jgi:hypothetical protein
MSTSQGRRGKEFVSIPLDLVKRRLCEFTVYPVGPLLAIGSMRFYPTISFSCKWTSRKQST